MSIEELLEKINDKVEIKKYSTIESLSNELLKLYCNKQMENIEEFRINDLSVLEDDVYFEVINDSTEYKQCYYIPLDRISDTVTSDVDGVSVLEEFNGECF